MARSVLSLSLSRWFALIAAVLVGAVGGAAGPAAADDGAGAARSAVAAALAQSPSSAELARTTLAGRVGLLTRCVDLREVTYCLGLGFRPGPLTPAEIDQMLAAEGTQAVPSGDLGLVGFVGQRTAMTDAERLGAESAELSEALAGAAKAAQYAALASGEAVVHVLPPGDPPFPAANAIMAGYQTRQERSYWCGPATFQSIDWADDKQKDTQASWAADLGTTTSGTAISSMVALTNSKTGWDTKAGTYVVQPVASWTAESFFEVHVSHLGDADPAPIIEHPRLEKVNFTYLQGARYSGHYQVGRGYDRKGSGTADDVIKIFEPFNEPDFASYTVTTWGPRDVPARNLLNATLANTNFKNIGL